LNLGIETPFSSVLGAKYTLSSSWNKNQSSGNSISIGSGVSALVETIQFEIQAENSEKCVVVKMNPNQLIDSEKQSYLDKPIRGFFHDGNLPILKRMAEKISDIEKYKLSDRGYMICSDNKSKTAFTATENYYIINQNIPTSQVTDTSSEASRSFFMALRGRGDLVSFISRIQGTAEYPESFKEDYLQSHLLFDETMPVFKRVLRSYPGQFVAPN
jgi:hypothetical protein